MLCQRPGRRRPHRFTTVPLLFGILACGQEPAFNDRQSGDHANSGDATAHAEGASSDAGETSPEASRAAADVGAAEVGADASGDSSPPAESHDPSAEDGTKNTSTSSSNDPDVTAASSTPAFDPAKGPIRQVQRVGVNFEDLDASQDPDFDYNDVVLCFSGEFLVQNSDVVANADQTVVAQVFSASGCSHRVDVHIVNPADNTFIAMSFMSKGTSAVNLSFKTGYKLEVWETPVSGPCEYPRSMHDGGYAKVLPNVCNLSGD